MNHSEIDQVSLEIARRAADLVRSNAPLLEVAYANLARWSRQYAFADWLTRCCADLSFGFHP